jgi:hypothetical protein
MTPFQNQEAEEWRGGEREKPVRRYLPRNWETHMQFALVWSFQPSFERRARLTSFIFLNPKPPIAFGRHKESQDLRDRLWDLFEGKPHQKSLNNLSNLLQKIMGRRKELIAKEGMVAATDLIRTNLPA